MKLASLIGLALAAVGTAAYAAATFARRGRPTTLRAIIVGAIFQVSLFAAIEGSKRFAPDLNSVFMVAVMAALLGAASSFLIVRHVA